MTVRMTMRTPRPHGRSDPVRRHRWRRGAPRRGVNDLVATILILGITVVLAASVFLWVITYPKAPNDTSDQFQVSLLMSGSHIGSISIQLTSGNSVSGAVYESYVRLESQQKPYAFTSPFSLASGLGGDSVWSSGQTWSVSLASYSLPTYDNISVLIESSGQVVFFGVTPPPPPVALPYIVTAGVTPSAPAKSTTFTVYCTVNVPAGLGATNPVTVNLSKVPGQSTHTKQALTNSSTTGQWTYTASGGASAAGTFTIYFTVVDRNGNSNVAVVTITVH